LEILKRYSIEAIVALSCLLVLSVGFLVRCHGSPVAGAGTAPIATMVGALERADAFPPMKSSDVKSSYSIDEILQGGTSQRVAGDRPATVALDANRSFVVVGWAVDSVARSAAAGVYVTLDGRRRIPALYGNPRPDVSTVLGFDATPCGFAALVDAGELAPGKHALGVDIVDAKQDVVFHEISTVTLDAGGPAR
jgi:hypothetical protein